MSKKRYYVAIVPEGEIQTYLQELKLHISEQYLTKAAMKSPAHLTLFPPFEVDENMELLLRQTLDRTVALFRPFDLRTNNFDYFPPRVAFVAVEPDEQLDKLERAVRHHLKELSFLRSTKIQSHFHPHITLGNRDWTPEHFEACRSELQTMTFREKIEVEEVCLLRYIHSQWQIIHRSPLLVNA
jgi:2'-5' RNA ligase